MKSIYKVANLNLYVDIDETDYYVILYAYSDGRYDSLWGMILTLFPY